MRSVRILALVAVGALGAACTGEHRILEDGCEFAEERTLAELLGPAPHDVILVGEPEPTHLVWSERGGLFTRALSGDAEPTRVGAPCEGGLATSGGLFACSRRGDDSKADPGHVAIYDVATGAVRERVGSVGPDGAGVGLAVDGDATSLVWTEARGTTSAVWLRREGAEPRRISREGMRGGRPSALYEHVDGERRIVVVWPETWSTESGVEGVLMAQRGERVLDLEPLGYDLSHPSLRAGPEGEAIVAFRDRRPARTRPRLFVRRLDRADTAHDGVHANADGEAIPVSCADAVVLVSPRTHSRSERLVAVRRHDASTLEGSGPEHQIYEHGAAFEHADARCVGRDVLVAIASSASIERPRGEIGTVRFRCPAPEAE